MPSNDMPRITPTISSELDKASAWLARLQSGSISAAEQRAFQLWLQENPTHQDAYNQVQNLWQSSTLDAALLHYADVPIKTRAQHKLHWLAAACLIITCAWSLQVLGLIDTWQADYVTATGEQHSFTLEDGSTVMLNTDSAFQVENSERVRQVRLLRGEAYFNVQPNPNRPFVVRSDSDTVRVVGTRFTVSSREQTQVAVEHGIVECANGRGDKTRLTAGQKSTLKPQNASAVITDKDTTQTFAWTKGRLVFKDRKLVDIVTELERYHTGKIVVANSQLRQTRLTGNYKLQDIPALVETLAQLSHADVFHLSPYLTILR
jgi:transmembrane sensor